MLNEIVTVVNTDLDRIKVHYMDYQYSTISSIQPGSMPKMSYVVLKEHEATLDKNIIDYDITKMVLDLYISEGTFLETLEYPNFNDRIPEFIKHDSTSEHSMTKRKIVSKILAASNRIAYESRIGPGDKIVMNNENYRLLHDVLSQINNLKIVIEDYVGDYCIIFRNDKDTGLKLVQNGKRFALVKFDNFPHMVMLYKFDFDISEKRRKKLERILC